MSDYVDILIRRYRSKGLLIDTNLLLLLVVGRYDLNLVGLDGFKRINAFTKEDYQLLERLNNLFERRVTTPHVLTEVSNLLGGMKEHLKPLCFEQLRALIMGLEELSVASTQAASRKEFLNLGLTDCVLAESADDFLIVTVDGRFAARINAAGLDALNFNHIRTRAWTW